MRVFIAWMKDGPVVRSARRRLSILRRAVTCPVRFDCRDLYGRIAATGDFEIGL